MNITYINHSGFLLETDAAAMLFDFAEGALPVLPQGKPLYVFVSHAHGDHYSRRIFTEVPAAAEKAGLHVGTGRTGVYATSKEERAPGLTYILSADIPARDVPEGLKERVVFMKPHEVWEDGYDSPIPCGTDRESGHITTPSGKPASLHIETLRSNDEGVAYVIYAGETDIYYAGDLNAWNWDGDAEDMELIRIYHEELARIAGRTFDVAFIPLDPRLGEEYTQGITDFFDVCGCDAKAVVPMHCWGKYAVISQACKKLASMPYSNRLAVYSHEGDLIPIPA